MTESYEAPDMLKGKKEPLTFVVSVNNSEVLRKNLLNSPVFAGRHPHRIIIREGFTSASLAYNSALAEAKGGIIAFVHQDLWLPEGWDNRFASEFRALEERCRLGVAGCYGITADGVHAGHVYSNGLKRELGSIGRPREVVSLDEIILAFRKETGLKFDPRMPHFHLYGTDICLEATQRKLKCFAVSEICLHNSMAIKRLPAEFWAAAEYLRTKWKGRLPVRTSCATIHAGRTRMALLRCMDAFLSVKRITPAKGERLDIPSHDDTAY